MVTSLAFRGAAAGGGDVIAWHHLYRQRFGSVAGLKRERALPLAMNDRRNIGGRRSARSAGVDTPGAAARRWRGDITPRICGAGRQRRRHCLFAGAIWLTVTRASAGDGGGAAAISGDGRRRRNTVAYRKGEHGGMTPRVAWRNASAAAAPGGVCAGAAWLPAPPLHGDGGGWRGVSAASAASAGDISARVRTSVFAVWRRLARRRRRASCGRRRGISLAAA